MTVENILNLIDQLKYVSNKTYKLVKNNKEEFNYIIDLHDLQCQRI